MREIDTGIKVACHAFMVGKFPAIVIGDGVYSVDVGAEALYDRMADSLSRLTGDGPDHRIQRLALNQRYHRTPVTLADHGVTLPIAEAALAIDNGRALINRDLVGNGATPAIGAIPFAPDLLTTQISVQIAA